MSGRATERRAEGIRVENTPKGGQYVSSVQYLCISLSNVFDAVIRLKQVEHIKNERNTLSAVAGHPFITTMITSFSDKDCLYMLVRDPISYMSNQYADARSLTIALEAKSSPTCVERENLTKTLQDSMLQRLC